MIQQDIGKLNWAYEMFEETGAIKTGPGHFVLASGDHGIVYINKKGVFKDSVQTSILCEQIAEHFKNSDIDAVAGPESGGIIMANWVAVHLSMLRGEKVPVVYFFKNGSSLVIERDREKKIIGKKILLVDDIVTTGSSLKKCQQIINGFDGKITGIGLLWIRGSGLKIVEMFQGIKLFSLINVRLDGWSEEQCRLIGPCSKGVPINIEHGHGAEFLKKHPEYKAVSDIPFIAGKNYPA